MAAAPLCLITGANTGIGRITAIEMAKRGYRLLLLGRSRERTESTIQEVEQLSTADPQGQEPNVTFLPVDLGSLRQVDAVAQRVGETFSAIDVLINNAGLAGARGKTEDGFELAFGVNHLGHFALTTKLLPLLQSASACRVVTVASRAHYKAPGLDFNRLRQSTSSRTGFPEYQVSKLANVLFASELARRFGSSSFSSFSLHPGVIASDVWREVPRPIAAIMKCFMQSNEDGAKTSLHCAVSPDALPHQGAYFDSCKVKRPSAIARDPQLAAELWQRSEAWLEEALA